MRVDSKERYGSISQFFHWGMAGLVGWQLLKLFDRIDDGEYWVAKQKGNRPEHNPATVILVKAGHFLLYAGMVLMPITGILTMLGNGYGWTAFGIQLTAFGIQLAAKGDEIAWMASLG